GLNPAVQLFCQSQGRLTFDETTAAFVPGEKAQRQDSVGAANGHFGLAEALSEGHEAGVGAAKEAGFDVSAVAPRAESETVDPLRPVWLVPSRKPLGHGPKHFVDFQNDVGAADLLLAHREGLTSVEHVKRYTTTGM